MQFAKEKPILGYHIIPGISSEKLHDTHTTHSIESVLTDSDEALEAMDSFL